MISDFFLGEGECVEASSRSGFEPCSVSPWLHPLSLFPHPPKEQQRLTGPLQRLSQPPGGCLPKAAFASSSPARPIPGLAIHFLPRSAEGIRCTRLSFTFMLWPPKGTDTQAPAHRPPWSSQGFQCQNPNPLMLEVPNSQRAAHKPGGRRVRHHGPQR